MVQTDSVSCGTRVITSSGYDLLHESTSYPVLPQLLSFPRKREYTAADTTAPCIKIDPLCTTSFQHVSSQKAEPAEMLKC